MNEAPGLGWEQVGRVSLEQLNCHFHVGRAGGGSVFSRYWYTPPASCVCGCTRGTPHSQTLFSDQVAGQSMLRMPSEGRQDSAAVLPKAPLLFPSLRDELNCPLLLGRHLCGYRMTAGPAPS